MRFIGIDLAGKETNPSGVCYIQGCTLMEITTLYTNNDIITYVLSRKPTYIAVDAPFDFPKTGTLRKCDLILKKLGLNPLPPILEGMRLLVLRAKFLKSHLEKRGIAVIETFPFGALKLLGYKRKPKSYSERYRTALDLIRLFGIVRWKKISLAHLSPHEFDALICAIVAYCVYIGKFVKVKTDDGEIYFPVTSDAMKRDFDERISQELRKLKS